LPSIKPNLPREASTQTPDREFAEREPNPGNVPGYTDKDSPDGGEGSPCNPPTSFIKPIIEYENGASIPQMKKDATLNRRRAIKEFKGWNQLTRVSTHEYSRRHIPVSKSPLQIDCFSLQEHIETQQ